MLTAAELGFEPRYPPPEGGVLLSSKRAQYIKICNTFPPSAAELGFEPRYPPPEGGVLPLDDSAALGTNKIFIHCRESAERKLRLPLDDSAALSTNIHSTPAGQVAPA